MYTLFLEKKGGLKHIIIPTYGKCVFLDNIDKIEKKHAFILYAQLLNILSF